MKQILCLLKNKDKIEKIIEIIFWIAVITLIATLILIKPLKDLDEIWNYNFSKNILEGRLPYKDFNIIIPPLVPYIGAVFLGFFGNEMISMRIFATIADFLILFFSYKILIDLKVEKNLSKIIILGLIYILHMHFKIDYNFFSLLLILVIINFEIGNTKVRNNKIDISLGILAGLCICSKHTIGICITIATLFYQILFVKDKETFKKFIKNFLNRLIGLSIVIGILCIYFTIFNLWKDFIGYAIIGIKDFNNSILYFRLITKGKWYLKVLSVVVPIYLIVNLVIVLIKKFSGKEIERYNAILLSYSWATFSVVFPISDEIHFLIGCVPSIISITYIVYSNLLSNKNKLIFIETVSQVLSLYIVIVAIISSINCIKCINKIDKQNQINHFKLIPDSSYSRVKEVDEYIKKQDRDVYILDARAALYTIPIDQYNKNYDMFNKGNLGAEGEEGIIEDLKKKKDFKILILQDKYNRNWQTPQKVIEFVKINFKKVGKVGAFDIYEK